MGIVWKTFVRGLHNVAGLDSPYSNTEYGPNWSKQRARCLERDGYECRVCESTKEEIGREPAVHHIKPRSEYDDNWEQNDLSNLVTLCPTCHGRFEGRFKNADPDEFTVKAQGEL